MFISHVLLFVFDNVSMGVSHGFERVLTVEKSKYPNSLHKWDEISVFSEEFYGRTPNLTDFGYIIYWVSLKPEPRFIV